MKSNVKNFIVIFMFACTATTLQTTKLFAEHETKSESQILVDVLLQYGKNEFNWPPLHYALALADYDAARFLIEHDANFRETVQTKDIHGKNFLCYPLDIIFLSEGVLYRTKKMEITGWRKREPIVHYPKVPIPSNYCEQVRNLLFSMIKKGALDSYNGYTCKSLESVLIRIVANDWNDIFEEAVKKMRSKSSIDWNIFYGYFISKEDVKGIQFLDNILVRNATIPSLNEKIITAVYLNQTNMIEWFIKQGANVNYRGGLQRKTPLEMAIKSGRKDIIELLISHGARLG